MLLLLNQSFYCFIGFDFTTVLNPNEVQTSDDTDKFKRFFLMRRKDTNLLDSKNIVNTFGSYDWYYVRIIHYIGNKFRK